jgi:DNA polymerase-3 subunit epsilon
VFLIVDCETNGLPRNHKAPVTDLANWPRAIQIAWALHDESHQLCSSATRIIRPEGFQIPPTPCACTGYPWSAHLARGTRLRMCSPSSQVADDAKVVVAHNAGFDGSVIAAEYLRLGLEPPFVPSSMICTMTQSTDYCGLSGPYGNKWPKLDELHMFLFGTLFGGANDAGVDVAACARCFFELVSRGVIRCDCQ